MWITFVNFVCTKTAVTCQKRTPFPSLKVCCGDNVPGSGAVQRAMLAGFQTLAKDLDLAHRSLDFYMGQIRGRQHQCSICHLGRKKGWHFFLVCIFFGSLFYFLFCIFFGGWLICLSRACKFPFFSKRDGDGVWVSKGNPLQKLPLWPFQMIGDDSLGHELNHLVASSW